MKKLLFLVLFLFCLPLTSCQHNRYIEKYSEPLAQAVYGVNDSLDKGRVDLTWFYSNQTVKLVPPPKNRIPIKAIYSHNNSTVKVKSGYTDEGQRVIIVPDSYKNNKVIVVDTAEYETLKKDSVTAAQLKDEIKSKEDAIKASDAQRKVDADNQSKLLNDYTTLQKTDAHKDTIIAKKDLAIIWRDIVIVVLVLLIAAHFYARANGLFFL